MSLADLVPVLTKNERRREQVRAASRTYRKKNLEACRAMVRAAKLKAKRRMT